MHDLKKCGGTVNSIRVIQGGEILKKYVTAAAIAISALLASCATVKTKPVSDIASAKGIIKVTKRSYEVAIRKSSVPVSVYNQLEDVRYDVKPEDNRVIITGTEGEEWLSKTDKVLKTYRKLDGTVLSEADIPVDTKLRVKTLPGSEYFAIFVPKDMQFRVKTSWGEMLTANRDGVPHGDGDYIVCAVKDGSPDFSDVWIVNGVIFPKTYEILP